MPFQKGHAPYPRKPRAWLTPPASPDFVAREDAKPERPPDGVETWVAQQHHQANEELRAPPINTEDMSAFLATIEESVPPIRRWLMSDLDDWLHRRLGFNYMMPEMNATWWANKIASFANSNDFLFITNEQAVLLARREPHFMTAKIVVREVFAWARSSELMQGIAYRAHENTPAEAALLPLYRRLMKWATETGAQNVTVGEASDLQPKRLERLYRSNGSYYLVRSPC